MKFKVSKATKRKGGKNTQISWPITYRWTAIGTVVACSAVGSKTVNVAYAQSVPPPNGSISKDRGMENFGKKG